MNSGPVIFLPNVTTPRNLGDAAMFRTALALLRQAHPHAQIVIGSGDPHLHSDRNLERQLSLFDWMVNDRPDAVSRLLRLGWVCVYYASYVANLPWLRQYKALSALLTAYERADLIVYVGCGFLRSRPGWKQTVNLFLILFMFRFATVMHKRIVVCPISFGPFAHRWQARWVAGVLKQAAVVAAREEISYAALRRVGLENVVLSCDHALLLPQSKKENRSRRRVGFTIRPWLPPDQQDKLESAYAQALKTLQDTAGVSLVPIVQVQAPHAQQEDDLVALSRVVSTLRGMSATVTEPVLLRDLSHAESVYGSLDLVLGMRMHSNIIAASQHVPFVAVAYEYKTQGIAATLGMERFAIPCEDVTAAKLTQLLTNAYAQRNRLKQNLKTRLAQLERTETARWVKVFREALA